MKDGAKKGKRRDEAVNQSKNNPSKSEFME